MACAIGRPRPFERMIGDTSNGMMIPMRSRGGGVLLILGVAASMAFGGDDPPAGKSDKLILFDGKGLEGWKKTAMFKAGEVKVEDGAIVIEVWRRANVGDHQHADRTCPRPIMS